MVHALCLTLCALYCPAWLQLLTVSSQPLTVLPQYQQQIQTLEQDRSMLNSRIKELQRMLGDKESDLKGATSTLRQSLRYDG